MPGKTRTVQRTNVDETRSSQDRRRGMKLRPLGTLERFCFLLDRHRSFNFAIVAQINGPSTVGDWRAALDDVQRRHPLLSARIDATAPSAPAFVRVADARIPLHVVADPEGTRWEAELTRELPRAFDTAQAPLLRSVVVLSARAAVCILIAHHSITDGLGLTYVLRDTLRALSGTRLVPLPIRGPQEAHLAAVVGPRVEASPAPLGAPVVHHGVTDAAGPIERLQLPAELTRALRQRARDEGTTVHGALCAALVLAARRIKRALADAPLRLISPINIRDMVDGADVCGNFVTLGTVVFAPDAPPDLWALARLAKTGLAQARAHDAVAAASHGMSHMLGDETEPAAVADIFAQAFAHELVVTNLANLPIESRYGALELDSVWGPWIMPRFAGSSIIGVATINGSLHLVHTGYAAMAGLLTAAEEVLIAALGGSSRSETSMIDEVGLEAE